MNRFVIVVRQIIQPLATAKTCIQIDPINSIRRKEQYSYLTNSKSTRIGMTPLVETSTTNGDVVVEPKDKSDINHTATYSDDEWIRMGEAHHAEERYLAAGRCFKSVVDTTKLTKSHARILEMVQVTKETIPQLISPNPTEDGWKQQGHKHGFRNTMVYYRVKRPENIIVSRTETPIEQSLLCPLLSVFNESSLYHTWMPHWDFPKLGLSESNMIREMGRGHQIVQVRITTPYPFANRECYLHAYAVDCIDEDDLNAIFVKIHSYDTGSHYEVDIPDEPKGYRRAVFDAGLLIRPCPPDHPSLIDSKCHYPDGEKLLLVTMMLEADGRVANVPLSIINFVTRTVLAKQWAVLLQIAEDVRSGTRVSHQNAIHEKQELYGWIEQRVKAMLDKI